MSNEFSYCCAPEVCLKFLHLSLPSSTTTETYIFLNFFENWISPYWT